MRHFEFVVVGIPRSVNAASRSLNRWKQIVRVAASASWDGAALISQQQISVVIIYFHREKTSIDVDNIAKPVVDALKGSVILDDFLVDQITCRRTELSEELLIDSIPDVLVEHFGVTADFLYIKIADGPNHSELPL